MTTGSQRGAVEAIRIVVDELAERLGRSVVVNDAPVRQLCAHLLETLVLWGYTGAFVVFSALFALGAVLVVAFGPESRSRTLEELVH